MKRLFIPNPRLDNSEVTYLDSDYTSGTSLTILQPNIFQNDNIAVIGKPGEEQTEAQSVASASGTTITIDSALSFDHNKGTPVYLSQWNQISVERQITTVGTWSVIDLINIQWDKLQSLYDDRTGSDLHSYRFRFYNSAGQFYSDYSPTIGGAGFSRTQVGAMILNVRKNVRDPNSQRVKDAYIIQLFGDCQTFLTGIRSDWWFLKTDTFELHKQSLANGITCVGGQDYYDLDAYSDLNYLARIRYHYQPSSTNTLYDLIPKSDEEFDRYKQDQSQQNDDSVLYYKQGGPDANSTIGYIVVHPTPSSTTGIFYPIYYKTMATLNTIDDTTPVPFPQILEDYASWQIHEDLGNKDDAARFKSQFFGNPVRGLAPNIVTGIALLEQHQRQRSTPRGRPRSLWRPRVGNGPGNASYFNHDYLKENFFDG